MYTICIGISTRQRYVQKLRNYLFHSLRCSVPKINDLFSLYRIDTCLYSDSCEYFCTIYEQCRKVSYRIPIQMIRHLMV